MSKYFILFCAVFSEILAEKSFYDDHARGWHWYEITKSQDEKKKRKNQSTQQKYPMTAELKEYQEQLEEAKALAVLYPTSENVSNYQKMQYEMTQKAGEFAEVWMRNIYKNSNLDYTQQVPVSQNARHVYLAEQRKKDQEKIRKLSNKYGLFFFFKNNCPYCEAFTPVVKRFSEMYQWEVLAIGENGEENKLFKRNVQDNGLAETWGVSSYPSLFAVNPKTGHVIPVAVGMVSIQEMEERILSIISEQREENDE